MKYILWLMPILVAHICCAKTIEDLQREIIGEPNYMDFIDHERTLGIAPFMPKIWSYVPVSKDKISSEIDKSALSWKIKSIVYQVFFEEMAIIEGDFSDMAQGHTDLAQDLKKLFCVSFNSGDEIAQRRLDEFCSKWELEKIEIRQLIDEIVVRNWFL